MVINVQLNLAKKLRASTTKEGALLARGSEEDVDTSVQVRKSNGVFVPRYSQPETKSKSNVEPTKDFIDAFKKNHDIDDCGLWSVFGQNYVERGAPDFNLLEKAQKHREERRRRRKGKKKAPEEGKQKKQGDCILTTWGGEKRRTQRLANAASSSKISIKDPGQESSMNSDAILDHSKYKFPMNFISDSENRLKQCKSGLPFAGLIDAQIRESGRLYPVLEVMKKRPSMRNQCSNTSDLSRLNSTNSQIEMELFDDDDNTFTIHLDEINRWREKFRSVCEDMQDDLSTELAQNKLDRIEVYQSRKALGEVARLAKKRSEGRNVPKPSSLWNFAKEVRIESSQIFYRELLTFVHMKMIREKKTHPTEEAVNLCVLIKDLLSQGQQADKELFFFCFHHFGVTCFEPCLMELFQFMRAYFSIREDRILHHIQKNGWYVSANKQKTFFDCN